MKKDFVYLLTGTAIAACSVALLASAAIENPNQKLRRAGKLFAGLAGIAVGTAVATRPNYKKRQLLTVQNLLNDTDVARIEQNIAEVLENRDEVCEMSHSAIR